jgi:hypothetical protein
MKRTISLVLVLLVAGAAGSLAGTTINATNRYAWSANTGWLDWRGDTVNGAAIGAYTCVGWLYGANTGWVNLGSGSAANGVRYQNNTGTDWGVNHDGLGNLRGYAWGANIGWVSFEATGAPKVDLKTGRLSGDVYSANCGWLSLSNAQAVVQTDEIDPGADRDGNGLPDAWEISCFGHTGVDPDADADQDGQNNRAEYLAGTNPNDPDDRLIITSYTMAPDGTAGTLSWLSQPNRAYYVLKTSDLGTGSWTDSELGLVWPDSGSSTTRALTDTNAPRRFYRVQPIIPLQP